MFCRIRVKEEVLGVGRVCSGCFFFVFVYFLGWVFFYFFGYRFIIV